MRKWKTLSQLLDQIEHGYDLPFSVPMTAFSRAVDGYTPLHIASIWDDSDAIILLLATGLNVNVQSDTGRTPLHAAVSLGHINAASALLIAGASVSLETKYGCSPLGIANRLRYYSIIELLRSYA
ncbi:MAG: ankyrin repeat domain-containing protein [Gemmataceae bacterium]